MIDLLTIAVAILAASALLLPLLQLTKGRNVNIPGYALAVVLGVSIVLIGAFTLNPSSVSWAGTLLSPDQLGGVFALVTVGVTLAVTLASFDFDKALGTPVFYSLLAFTALGMVLLAYSQDLLILFVAWELMSLPTYALAGFDKKLRSNEASVKYAIIGAMSSAIILYAISLAYGLTGSTQISVVAGYLARYSGQSPLAGVATLLFVAGFGFKMSIVPFHMWIPDAYEGAPTTVSTLLAAATKKAGFIAAIRVLLAVTTLYVITQNPMFTIANVLAVLALLTMTLGNVAALTQKSMTRLLAYSSIAQAGYILIGFVIYSYGQGNAAFAQQAQLGMTGALFHIINHSVMKGAAFLGAGLVILKLGSGSVAAFDGLGRRMPVTAFAMAISLLALAGVPPLSGFWSKLLLFTSVLNGPYAWLAVAGVLNTALSMGYYGWLIKRIYFDETDGVATPVQEPFSFVVILGVLVALIVALGVFPGAPISFARSAVPSVAGH